MNEGPSASSFPRPMRPNHGANSTQELWPMELVTVAVAFGATFVLHGT